MFVKKIFNIQFKLVCIIILKNNHYCIIKITYINSQFVNYIGQINATAYILSLKKFM